MTANGRPTHDEAVLDIHTPPQSFALIPSIMRESEWEQAIRHKSVRFDVLADAHYRSKKSPQDLLDQLFAKLPTSAGVPDEPTHAAIRRLSDQYLQRIACLYYLTMVPIFQQQYGKIIRVAHINEPEPCYIALTSLGEIFVSGSLVTRPDVVTAEERTIFLDCLLLSREVQRVVRFPQGRQTCGDAIFSVIATLLNAVSERYKTQSKAKRDGQVAPPAHTDTIDMAFMKARYRRAVALCEQFGIRDSRCIYLYALIVVTALSCIGYSLIVLQHWLPQGPDANHFLIPANCAFAGTVGASMSMIIRVSRGSLDASYRAGQVLLILAALFRPLIGLVFAFIIYALTQAKLTPFLTLPDGANPNYFFITLGFIAGFSERLVPRLLASTEGNLMANGTTPNDADESGGKTSGTGTAKEARTH